MTHKITLELTDDELEMLASLFNTVVICEMNADGKFSREAHPPINRFCHWSKCCKYLCDKFTFNRNLNKYPSAITRALVERLKCKSTA